MQLFKFTCPDIFSIVRPPCADACHALEEAPAILYVHPNSNQDTIAETDCRHVVTLNFFVSKNEI